MARSECGSITKVSDGVYRVRVSYGKDPETGRRLRASRNVRGSYQDAKTALIELEAEHMRLRKAPTGMTIGQYLEGVYLPAKRRQVELGEYAKTTYASLSWDLRHYVIPQVGSIKMTEFGVMQWDAWLAGLPTQGRRHQAACRLATAWKQAIAWELLPADYDITKRARIPKKPAPAPEAADPELLGKILMAFRGNRLEPVVLVMAFCGLRCSEACALSWEDVDTENMTVSVRRSFHCVGGECFFAPTKTPASRSAVSLPASAAARLAEIRESRGADGDEPICPARNDAGRVHPNLASKIWRETYRRELPDERYVPIKSMRHTHATLLIMAGVDISVVSKRLRHTSIQTTAQIYVRNLAEIDRAAAETFDALLNGAHRGPTPVPKASGPDSGTTAA